MVYIKPFRALRPRDELVSKVNSPPYDILSQEEARTIIKNNPYSFLKVVKPEATILEEKEITDHQLAEIAARNLQEMIRQKIFFQEEKECFYLYSQSNESYRRIGLVACLSIEDYLQGVIKKHENVNLITYHQRVKHIKITKAHTGCILIVYKNNHFIDKLIECEIVSKKPIYDFESNDGIKNICWKIEESETITLLIEAFQDTSSLYIADGHHRTAAAVETAQIFKEKRKNAMSKDKNMDDEYMYFPAVLIPDNQIHISAYHRLVSIPSNLNINSFLEQMKQVFEVKILPSNKPFLPVKRHEFGMNIFGQWYRLVLKEDLLYKLDTRAWDHLDVSILQNLVLKPLFGIENPQKSDRIKFFGGSNALTEIEDKSKRESVAAFTLFPTSIREVIEVSEKQQVMPPKSTWFEPKLRSGIFIHLFD